MKEMTWDNELARDAQRWAESCPDDHGHFHQDRRFHVGQNIGQTFSESQYFSSSSDFAETIPRWFEEVNQFIFGRSRINRATGHYTQLVWADSHLVGCGYAYFHDQMKGYTKVHVCNYGPAGNVRGRSPYRAGSPTCLDGTVASSEYRGLCSTTDHVARLQCRRRH
ncbi:venom allergen 3-like [Thrips palmi]|uniref:Venom allergen 3-like n=1 Tax=Thrips palmi TaxID=161013 RepID=A0A6P8Z9Q4_THRPL|nr:venom allergen 3-like [Thrips palmi]